MDSEMPKPRLLLVGDRLDPYPPFNEANKIATLLLARQLAGLGVHVWVLGLSKSVRFRFRLEREQGVTYVVLNSRRLPRGHRRHRLLRVLIDSLQVALRSDVICSFDMYLRPLFARGRRWLWVATHHSFEEAMPVDAETFILAENPTLYQRVQEHFPRNQVHLRYPGVDLAHFCPRSSSGPGNPVRFLFASSPLPEHATVEREEIILRNRGVHEILEISDRLARHIPVETVLLWRKDPTYARTLLPGSSVVRVVDELIPDMSAYMEGFDFCFCLFHDRLHVKGIPQSMIEALAKGLPVVAFRGTSFGDLVERYQAGMTLGNPVSDEDVQALLEVCTDGERYRRMAKGAIRCAQECFDIQREAQEIFALLQGAEK
jgi:glycosyltransferase involved in cell wall biosynthesis